MRVRGIAGPGILDGRERATQMRNIFRAARASAINKTGFSTGPSARSVTRKAKQDVSNLAGAVGNVVIRPVPMLSTDTHVHADTNARGVICSREADGSAPLE